MKIREKLGPWIVAIAFGALIGLGGFMTIAIGLVASRAPAKFSWSDLLGPWWDAAIWAYIGFVEGRRTLDLLQAMNGRSSRNSTMRRIVHHSTLSAIRRYAEVIFLAWLGAAGIALLFLLVLAVLHFQGHVEISVLAKETKLGFLGTCAVASIFFAGLAIWMDREEVKIAQRVVGDGDS